MGSEEGSNNGDGDTSLTHEELEIQQDEKKASDLMWADPLYLLAAKEKIAFVNQIAEKNLDYTDKEYAKIFQPTFGQNDAKQYRAESLKALHHYVIANFSKIMKIVSFAKQIHTTLTDTVHTLSDLSKAAAHAGIDEDNVLYERVNVIQESLANLGLLDVVEGSMDSITDLTARTVAMEREVDEIKTVKTFDVSKLEADVKEITDRFGTLNPITMDSKINANSTKLNTLQTISPYVEPLKQLAEVKTALLGASRVDCRARLVQIEKNVTEIRENQTLLKTEYDRQFLALEEIKSDSTRVNNVLEQVKDIQQEINQSPAGQNVHRSMLGSVKIPELKSLDPAEFRTWKDLFMTHVDLHKWSDEIATKALKLAIPDPKVYVPLKLATPNWETLSLKEILFKWEKRCCPDSNRDLAITQLSQLHQGLDEASLAYIDRAVQLYTSARFDDDLRDPETDLQFIQRLINTFRDTRLKAPLRRRKPATISALRIALNEEMNILESDPATASQVAALAESSSINKFGGAEAKNPNEKKPPKCNFCSGTHVDHKCFKIKSFLTVYNKDQKKTQEAEQKNQNQKGQRGRGRGRGRGNFRGKNNYYGNGNNQNNQNDANKGEDFSPTPNKQMKWENKNENQKN